MPPNVSTLPVESGITHPLGLVVEPSLASPDQLEPGATLGHFTLLRKIGQGGMGLVFLAQQNSPIERLVALKLVQSRFKDSLAEAMFLVERQALARLEHPGIARVYEAGTTDRGALFFAMEWIDGERIDGFCREQRLLLPAILRLLIQVCRGVQHAHLKGVLHRDLKPANILVRRVVGETEPVARIIDFGIATSPGLGNLRPAGTAGYMSPEQVQSGEILDQRCDVYALGVMLLELSMQALGIQFSEWWWLDSTARFDSLRSPAPHADRAHQQSLPLLPIELRAVVIKAIDPDRERRYASAEAFAADLQCLLEQRPVQALPASGGYLLRKFVTRNRIAVISSAVGMLLLLGLLLVAWTGWQQAERANRDAELTADFLRSILAEVDPERALGMDTQLLRLVLDAAAQRSAEELAEAPQVRAAVEVTIAQSYRGLGELRTATDLATRAYAAAESSLGAQAPLTFALALERARSLDVVGERAAARALCEQRQPQALQAFGPAHPQTLAWTALLVRSRRQQSEIKAAIALGQQILDRVTADQVRSPPNFDPWIELQLETAMAMSANGQFEPALQMLQHVLAAQLTEHANNFGTTRTRGEVGAVLFMAKRYTEARAVFAEVLPEHIRILGAEHPTTLIVRSNLAASMTLAGDPKAAAVVHEELLAIRLKVNGPEHPETLTVIGNLAAALWRAEQYPQAEQQFRRYLGLCEKVLGPAHGSCAERFNGLGKTLREQGKYAEAETAFIESWQRKRTTEAPQFAGPDKVAAELVELYRRWNKPEKIELWSKRAASPAESRQF